MKKYTEHHDRLLDMLLCELLGGETPPDLTAAVMTRADRATAGRRGIKAALALAAGLTLALGLWWMFFRYPAPTVSGVAGSACETRVERGAIVATSAEPALVSLGGYARVRVEPQSKLRVNGGKRQETVFLEQGAVQCEVERDKGAFAVETRIGIVRVKGTRFSVRLQKQGGTDMRMGTLGIIMAVAVASGSVEVQYGGQTYTLGTGATQAFGEAAEAAVSATVVSVGDNKLTVRVAGVEKTYTVPAAVEKKWEEKTAVEKSQALARIAVEKTLRPGMQVQVKATGDRLDAVQAAGTVEGEVAGGKEGELLVKVDGVEGTIRFVARWEKGPNGQWRPKPSEVEQMRLKAGTKVRVSYELEEHLRVNKLEVIDAKER